jgi:hypothetical protein
MEPEGARLTANRFQNHDHIRSTIAETGINDGRELCEDSDHSQHADHFSHDQLIVNKIPAQRLLANVERATHGASLFGHAL